MEHRFDLIVLGTGTAGSTVAHRCRKAGWEVAIVDSRPFGGTCALRGCDPKKVLVGVAEALDGARRLTGKGVAGRFEIDWSDLMDFKRTFTDPVPERRERSYTEAGISTFHGRARFVGPSAVRVDDEVLEARKILVATGSKPMRFDFPGEQLLVTSDEFLELDQIPDRIIFLGGGFISFEFAHVSARAGAQVRILEMLSRPLQGFDADLVTPLVVAGRDAGVDVTTDTEVTAIEETKEGLTVAARTGDRERTFEADMVVHGGGRVPEIDDLDLETAGVERTRNGVAVSPTLRSRTNQDVYAAGDAAATEGLPLTPVAAAEGIAVAKNLLEQAGEVPDYRGIPAVVFTIPPLAGVGPTEEQAREQGLDFDVRREDMSEWYTHRRVGEEHAASKILVEKDGGRILGAHHLGIHAEEVANIFALAIRHGLTAADLKKMPWAYPTATSDIPFMV